MPLSETGSELLASLRKKHISKAQDRHHELLQEARRKAGGNQNTAALPAYEHQAHVESLTVFGQAILTAYREAFEMDRSIPGAADEEALVRELADCIQQRSLAASDEFARQDRIRNRPPSNDQRLNHASSRIVDNLRTEAKIWRLERQRAAATAGNAIAPVQITIPGDHNTVAVAGGNQNAISQFATNPSADALSDEEAELLRSAVKKGVFLIMAVDDDDLGEWVRGEARDFIDGTDPAVAARFLHALESIEQRGLAKRKGTISTLTIAGFEKARSL